MNLRFILKNKKGISLIEVLLYVALLGMVLPMVSTMLMHGFDSYKSNYRFIEQENMISNVTHLIRKDIESAKTIIFNPDGKEITLKFSGKSDKTWKFDSTDSTIKVGSTIVARNIDVSKSSFDKQIDSLSYTETHTGAKVFDKGYILLTIKPVETNKKIKNRNFTKPIITEFSVRYKEIQ
ncbi:MAG TPA: hypothetical protein VIO64_22450 [Pseudobacteroides sp.]|uniref:PulJ/GspJ family protein n=1 Tax=Pseudobacteroides sp. TaxID=1968840 RepID=UPI002F94081F